MSSLLPITSSSSVAGSVCLLIATVANVRKFVFISSQDRWWCTPSSALLPIQNIPKFSAATATQRYVHSAVWWSCRPFLFPLEIVANCFYPFHSFINSRRQQLVACTPDSPNLTIHSHTHLFAEASRDERHGWRNVCLSLWEEECYDFYEPGLVRFYFWSLVPLRW